MMGIFDFGFLGLRSSSKALFEFAEKSTE